MLEDGLEARLADNVDVVASSAEAVGAELELRCGFFAADVENSLCLDVEEVLEEEGALADSGLTSEKDHRAGHEAASEHAVEFAGRHFEPPGGVFGVGVNLVDCHGDALGVGGTAP